LTDRNDTPPVLGHEWDSTLEFDGVTYRASWVPAPIDAWTRAVLVEGLPERHVDTFLAAAQEADTKPAWQVDDQPGEPPERRLARARERLRFDLDVYESRFVSGFGEAPDGRLLPIGCAAVRRRMTPDFESPTWVTVGRIVILPELRSKGVAASLLAQFLAVSQGLCGRPALGFVMETESGPIRKLLQRAVEGGLLDVIPFEPRRHLTADDETFVCFYPDVRGWALARTEQALAEPALDAVSRSLVEQVRDTWTHGASRARCARMNAALVAGEGALAAAAERDARLSTHIDFLRMLRAWGVLAGAAEIPSSGR
jgi:GNAT superfamily N-acetyltransferase